MEEKLWLWLAFRCWNWPRRITCRRVALDRESQQTHEGWIPVKRIGTEVSQHVIYSMEVLGRSRLKLTPHTSQLPCSLPSTQGNQWCCFKPLQPMVGWILEVAAILLWLVLWPREKLCADSDCMIWDESGRASSTALALETLTFVFPVIPWNSTPWGKIGKMESKV